MWVWDALAAMGGFGGLAALISSTVAARRAKTIQEDQKTNHGSEGRIGGAVDAITEKLNHLGTDLQDIKGQVGSIREDVTIVRQDFTELGKRVTTMERRAPSR